MFPERKVPRSCTARGKGRNSRNMMVSMRASSTFTPKCSREKTRTGSPTLSMLPFLRSQKSASWQLVFTWMICIVGLCWLALDRLESPYKGTLAVGSRYSQKSLRPRWNGAAYSITPLLPGRRCKFLRFLLFAGMLDG